MWRCVQTTCHSGLHFRNPSLKLSVHVFDFGQTQAKSPEFQQTIHRSWRNNAAKPQWRLTHTLMNCLFFLQRLPASSRRRRLRGCLVSTCRKFAGFVDNLGGIRLNSSSSGSDSSEAACRKRGGKERATCDWPGYVSPKARVQNTEQQSETTEREREKKD